MDETPHRRVTGRFGKLPFAAMVFGSAIMAMASTASAASAAGAAGAAGVAGVANAAAAQARLHSQVQIRALTPLPVPPFAPLTIAGAAPAPDFGTPSADGMLAATRGGSDTTVNDTRLGGIVSGNTAVQVVTGANVIQASSFADAAGIPIVIQNSGANVLIQNATVINLKFN